MQGDLQEVHSDIKIDPVFRKLPKNTICFHIWKVEQDRIEAVPKNQYGNFSDDCTYIIYGACIAPMHINQDTITRDVKNPAGLERFIHFWLGQKTSPQKSGNVAFKIMELDSYFGHIATQYRETQGNESPRFLSYFKKGLTILSSVANESNSDCRLFQITGRQWPICNEMNSVSWEHFSCDYTMILKTSRFLFVWLGRSSGPIEKRNGLNAAIKMRDDLQIPELITVDDGYEQSMNNNAKEEWNTYLPLKTRFVNQTASIEKLPESPLKLYKCGYHTGKYRIEEIKTTPPDQCDFNDPEWAFIIDGCALGVWMWLGKSVASQEKIEAMRNARGFVKKKKYPYSTPVVRVIEDHEPVEFKHLFSTWNSPTKNGIQVSTILGKLDSLTLLQRPKMAAESQLIDDGSGEKHIFRLNGDQYSELTSEKNIFFFSSECYILKYTITLSETNHIQSHRSKCNTVLYFWTGKHVLPEIKLKCEELANTYFKTLGKNSTMFKITEGSETPHFLQIFGGKFIVFRQRNNNLTASSLVPSSFVLKVIGDCTYNSKAVQVNPLECMSSKDCFVIKTSSIWVWCGQSSTGDRREAAKSIGNLLGEFILVLESKEPDEFWASITKEFDQLEIQKCSENKSQNPCEIFDTSTASVHLSFMKHGNIFRKEIISFDQSDLVPENVYLLDAKNVVFIWIGELSSMEEYKLSWLMAKNFLCHYPTIRNEDTAIALVRQGYEPNIFVGFFDSWEDNFWDKYISYERLRHRMELTFNPTEIISIEGYDFDKHQKYPLSVLQQEAEQLPPAVDITRKEVHLTHDDFVELFRMKYSEFDSLPSWKKQELKKKYKLF